MSLTHSFEDRCFCPPSRKSSSWHTSLRIRRKSEKKEKEAKKETKLENGYRKARDGLANKVSVKVSRSERLFPGAASASQLNSSVLFSASKPKLHLRR